MNQGKEGEWDNIQKIKAFIRSKTNYSPSIGIICGSGLAGLANLLTDTVTIAYKDVPCFFQSTVAGHTGELVFGKLQGVVVLCFRGRFHTYEGYDIKETTRPVRIMQLLGVNTLIVTNAAGGLNRKYCIGDLMIISDHINLPGLVGKHPLVGPNDSRLGDRFFPLGGCYDRVLQRIVVEAAKKIGRTVRQGGVYGFVSGPSYETPAEALFLSKHVGCDAVGMSTVPEVVVAAHAGIRVLGLSLITNNVRFPGDRGDLASHEEVLESVQESVQFIECLVRHVVVAISEGKDVQLKEIMANETQYSTPCMIAAGAIVGLGLALVSSVVFRRR